jgi:hypothetical protein
MPDMARDQFAYQYDGVLKHSVNLTIGAFLNDQLVGNLRFFQISENHPWVKHTGAFGMVVVQDYWGEGLGKRKEMIIPLDRLRLMPGKEEQLKRMGNLSMKMILAGIEFLSCRKQDSKLNGTLDLLTSYS